MNEKEKIIGTYQKKEVSDVFDKEREEFAYLRYKHKLEAGILKRAIKNLKNPRVLDVACGTGRMLPVIFEANGEAEYFGLDTSDVMTTQLMKKAKELGVSNKIKIIISDAAKIPAADNTFDMVFSYHLLWHLPIREQKKIIKEMLRVTKPGGLMVFDILNSNFVWEKIKGLFGRKKTAEIYKTNIKEIRGLIGESKVEIDKLSDAIIKNSLLYTLYNFINLSRKILPSSLYHMLYFTVTKGQK